MNKDAPEFVRYDGIQGWLFLFALQWSVFQPAGTIWQLYSAFSDESSRSLYQLARDHKVSAVFLILICLIVVYIAVRGLVIAARIFQRHQDTKVIVTKYLSSRLKWTLLCGVFMLGAFVATDNAVLLPEGLVRAGIIIVPGFFGYLILQTYWDKSKRVKWTFMSAADKQAFIEHHEHQLKQAQK